MNCFLGQIAAVEQRLKLCQNRIEDIDKKLQREELGVEERLHIISLLYEDWTICMN